MSAVFSIRVFSSAEPGTATLKKTDYEHEHEHEHENQEPRRLSFVRVLVLVIGLSVFPCGTCLF